MPNQVKHTYWFPVGPIPFVGGSLTSMIKHMDAPEHMVAGIVACEDDLTGKRKAYFGLASGENEKEDIQRIKRWGQPVEAGGIKQLAEFLAGGTKDNEK